MNTKSNNTEIMVDNGTDEICEELLNSFLQRYQKGLEEKWEEVTFLW